MAVSRRELMTPFRWTVVVVLVVALLIHYTATSPDIRAGADTVIRIGSFVAFIWLFKRRRSLRRPIALYFEEKPADRDQEGARSDDPRR